MSGATGGRPNAGPARVAVVGAGVIGRSWMRVFARAGYETAVHDPVTEQLDAAFAWLDDDLERERRDGLVSDDEAAACRARVRCCATLAEALEGARYVQENGPEQLESKRAIYAALDRQAEPDAILASSTSAHDMTTIAAGLPGAWRCIVAHPVNPPHVVPVVEVLPGSETAPHVLERTLEFLATIGQTPVALRRYVPGFLLNRMQAALVREAISLVERGIADVDAVDAVVREGLGLRWALLGPFGVAHTNADGGVRDYLTRYGDSYRALMDDLGSTPTFDTALVERLGQGTDAMLGRASHDDLLRWRDRLVLGIRALKQADPIPGSLPFAEEPSFA